MNKDILVKIGLVSGGVAAGSVSTYFITRGVLTKKFNARADAEIQSVKDTYKLLRKEGEYADPQTALEAYKGRVKELQYAAEDASLAAVESAGEQDIQQEADAEKQELRNIFDEASKRAAEDRRANEIQYHLNNRDYETVDQIIDQEDPERFDELATRDPMDPFHISKAEFFDITNEFDKLTLTYYESDDTLADDHEQPIRDIEATVGTENLTKFGQDSEDVNVTYVRNERLRSDFEVVLDKGSYIEEVLGIKDENPNRVRRMRDDE